MKVRRTQYGSLLIVTLWIIIILGALTVALARYLSSEIRLTKYHVARTQAQAFARSGVYLAMRTLVQDATPADWAGDPWAIPRTLTPAAGWRLTVSVTDEERKLNVNAATQAQLERLLGRADLVAQLLDYRDAEDRKTDRPSDHPPYYAKNGPVTALEELSDLPTMDDGAYNTLRTSTSPYSAPAAPMNINTVTRDVLRAVGVSDGAIELVNRFREGPDGPDEHKLDGIFQEAGLKIIETLKDTQGVDLKGTDDGNLLINTALFGISSRIFTVVSEAVADHPAVRVRVEAVLQRFPQEKASVPRVIAWREG